MNYDFYHSKIDEIHGFLCPGQERFLFDYINNLPKSSLILEIGSHQGRSTISMGFAAKNNDSKIIAVDIFSEEESFNKFIKNIKDNELENTISYFKERSDDFLKKWDSRFPKIEIDFVFIDGSHDYQDVLSDFILVYPFVRVGGYISFHDVIETWPGSYYAWHNFAKKVLSNHDNSNSLFIGKKVEQNLYFEF